MDKQYRLSSHVKNVQSLSEMHNQTQKCIECEITHANSTYSRWAYA